MLHMSRNPRCPRTANGIVLEFQECKGKQNLDQQNSQSALCTLVTCPWEGFGAPAFRHLQVGFAIYFTCISMGKAMNEWIRDLWAAWKVSFLLLHLMFSGVSLTGRGTAAVWPIVNRQTFILFPLSWSLDSPPAPAFSWVLIREAAQPWSWAEIRGRVPGCKCASLASAMRNIHNALPSSHVRLQLHRNVPLWDSPCFARPVHIPLYHHVQVSPAESCWHCNGKGKPCSPHHKPAGKGGKKPFAGCTAPAGIHDFFPFPLRKQLSWALWKPTRAFQPVMQLPLAGLRDSWGRGEDGAPLGAKAASTDPPRLFST